MNSFDDLVPECLGHAGVVYEHVLVGPSVLICKLQRLREITCVVISENHPLLIIKVTSPIKMVSLSKLIYILFPLSLQIFWNK